MKRINLVGNGFVRREDLDFRDDGTKFYGYEYAGMPITYAKDSNYYYICVRVDYLKNDFTYTDWMETEEYRLGEEFNGVGEVDEKKLAENCVKIRAKVDALNEEVRNEKIDVTPIVEEIYKEVAMAEEVIAEFKANYKWWEANEWALKSMKDYLADAIRRNERARRRAEDYEANLVSVSQTRYDLRMLNKYGYVFFNEGDFYMNEMRKAMA